MRIGLRVCVNSLQGALQGVPNLQRLLDEYQIKASFFFALGPDHGRRFFSGHPLASWRGGLATLPRLVASLLPPTLISRRVAGVMRSLDESGHEIGVLSYDPVNWLRRAAFADDAWTREQMTRAVEAYDSVLHRRPRCHAAAGWQVNPHLLRLEQALGFDYAADVRGKSLFLPELLGVESACPQIPTTLPWLPELLASGEGATPDNVHEYLYAESQYLAPHGHVYSLDAEIEGLAYLPMMEKLVVMWKGYGEGLSPLGRLLEGVDAGTLKRHRIGWQPEGLQGSHLARQALPL